MIKVFTELCSKIFTNCQKNQSAYFHLNLFCRGWGILCFWNESSKNSVKKIKKVETNAANRRHKATQLVRNIPFGPNHPQPFRPLSRPVFPMVSPLSGDKEIRTSTKTTKAINKFKYELEDSLVIVKGVLQHGKNWEEGYNLLTTNIISQSCIKQETKPKRKVIFILY